MEVSNKTPSIANHECLIQAITIAFTPAVTVVIIDVREGNGVRAIKTREIFARVVELGPAGVEPSYLRPTGPTQEKNSQRHH